MTLQEGSDATPAAMHVDGNGCGGRAEDLRDLGVGVTGVVSQDDGGPLMRRQLTKRSKHVEERLRSAIAGLAREGSF